MILKRNKKSRNRVAPALMNDIQYQLCPALSTGGRRKSGQSHHEDSSNRRDAERTETRGVSLRNSAYSASLRLVMPWRRNGATGSLWKLCQRLPLPLGEGQGEGEQKGRRAVGAAGSGLELVPCQDKKDSISTAHPELVEGPPQYGSTGSP